MAFWYDPADTRANCVAKIVTDATACLVTDPDGKTTLDIAAFMSAAATALAAIPDPPAPEVYISPFGLRGLNVRPMADTLVATLATIGSKASDVNLQALQLDLEAKSKAVSDYYSKAYSIETAAKLRDSLSSAPLDNAIPQADSVVAETRYWRATWVDDWGLESEPSEVSAGLEVGPSDTVTVSEPSVPASRNIAYWRIYRSNTSNETAEWEYVPNSGNALGVPVATTSFTDNVANEDLKERCPSTLWNEPPTAAEGVVGCANFHLMWYQNVLCPSALNAPHAYPVDYRRHVEWPIVGACAFQGGAMILTKGKPYFVEGSDPANLNLRKLDSNQPCLNKASIASTERGVVYASREGLCLATPGGVEVITKDYFTSEDWSRLLTPSSVGAIESEGTLYFTTLTSGTSIAGPILSLLMSEANGTTTPTDTGTGLHTLTRNGTPSISTDVSSPTGVSCAFDGAADYYTVPSTLFTITGTFTFECYVKHNYGFTRSIFGWAGAASDYFNISLSNAIPSNVQARLNSTSSLTGGSVTGGTWTHIEVSRDGSNLVRIFVNGVLATSSTLSGTVVVPTGLVYIGRRGDGNSASDYDGRMRRLRFWKGVCLHTANFTPP